MPVFLPWCFGSTWEGWIQKNISNDLFLDWYKHDHFQLAFLVFKRYGLIASLQHTRLDLVRKQPGLRHVALHILLDKCFHISYPQASDWKLGQESHTLKHHDARQFFVLRMQCLCPAVSKSPGSSFAGPRSLPPVAAEPWLFGATNRVTANVSQH